jgi:hypothetical protein
VTSRPHGRGHGTLVSHSTDVGCISNRRKTDVKKMLLVCAVGVAGLAIATTMSARPAVASWVLIPGDTNDTRLHGCGSSWAICKYRSQWRPQAYRGPQYEAVQKRIRANCNPATVWKDACR